VTSTFGDARDERECGTLTFRWTQLRMFRWPMVMGFAVLGLFRLPMQLIVRNFIAFRVMLAIFLICLAGMYVFGCRNLPALADRAPVAR
jgi:hypothetical protein